MIKGLPYRGVGYIHGRKHKCIMNGSDGFVLPERHVSTYLDELRVVGNITSRLCNINYVVIALSVGYSLKYATRVCQTTRITTIQ